MLEALARSLLAEKRHLTAEERFNSRFRSRWDPGAMGETDAQTRPLWASFATVRRPINFLTLNSLTLWSTTRVPGCTEGRHPSPAASFSERSVPHAVSNPQGMGEIQLFRTSCGRFSIGKPNEPKFGS